MSSRRSCVGGANDVAAGDPSWRGHRSNGEDEVAPDSRGEGEVETTTGVMGERKGSGHGGLKPKIPKQ
jgi:hypothetical protein